VIDLVLVSLLSLPVLSLSNTGKHGLVINTVLVKFLGTMGFSARREGR
jgi:hypothetical protein